MQCMGDVSVRLSNRPRPAASADPTPEHARMHVQLVHFRREDERLLRQLLQKVGGLGARRLQAGTMCW